MVCGRPWRCRVNGASYAHARRVTYLGGGIIVELYVAGENTVLLYEFSGRPEPSVVMPSGSYPVTHRQFEERGLLHHPWVACSELTMPLTLRRWEPETGWRDQDIRLVTNRRYTRLFGNRHIILPHKAETSPVTKRFLRIVQRDPDADFFLQRGLVLLRGQRLSPARRQYGVGELSLLGVAGGGLVVDGVFVGRIHKAHVALARFQGADQRAGDFLFGEALGLFLAEPAIHQDGDIAAVAGGLSLLRLLGRIDELQV